MGCGGSTPAGKKYIEVAALSLGAPPSADLLAALVKHLTETGTAEFPVEKQDDPSAEKSPNTSFKIKGMQFVLSKTDADSLCSADNAVAVEPSSLALCVVSAEQLASAEEAVIAQLASVASAPTLKGAVVLVVVGEMDEAQFSAAKEKLEACKPKKIYYHSTKAFGDDDGVVKFFFNAAVAVILEENLKASEFPKAKGGW